MTADSILSRASSLQQRVLTSVILGPAVIGAVLWLPTPGFALFLALVVLVGAWEWGGLTGLKAPAARAAYLGTVAVIIGLLWIAPQWRPWLVLVGAAWWVFQTVALARLRLIVPRQGADPMGAAAGVLVLCAPWAALVNLHASAASGPALVLFLFLLVWIADSVAYFVGRRWGSTKLAPVLSPGKTRVGVYGALAAGTAGGALLGYLLSRGLSGSLLAALVCTLTVVFSVVGDLYESLLKRRRGAKDSGHLLPGHGGMLDRIDSLTAAAPVFTLGLSIFGVVNT